MGTDLTMTIALLHKVGLLTKKEAQNLYDELKFKNLSSDVNECINILTAAFKKHSIGITPTVSEVVVDGKKISITK
jgi:hypothetical protein